MCVFLQQVENGAFNWSMMPAELRPNWKRKYGARDALNVAKDVNVEETLKALEQKEKIKKTDNIKTEDEDKNSESVSISLNCVVSKTSEEVFPTT